MNNARYCRIGLRSLDENCYLLCKSTNDGLTAAGRALFLLNKIDSRAEVREDAPTRLCKSCYDLVLRVKKNDDDVAAKKESLKERLAKSRSFFFRTKHQREPSSPVPSRIPTPTRSPASKRILTEQRQRTSARKLTFAQPIQSTSDLPQPLAVEQEFSLARPSTKGLPQDRTYTALPSVNLELNKQALQLIIDNECDKLCSPNSIFRRTSTDLKEDFSWQAYEEELKKTAPTLWLVLDTASSSLGTTYIRKRKGFLLVTA